MKFLKKYNESNKTIQFTEEIDDFLLKVRDDLANISDEYYVKFESDNSENLKEYKNNVMMDYCYIDEDDDIPFYINISLKLDHNKDFSLPNTINNLDKLSNFYKKINHLIKTSDFKFKLFDPERYDDNEYSSEFPLGFKLITYFKR